MPPGVGSTKSGDQQPIPDVRDRVVGGRTDDGAAALPQPTREQREEKDAQTGPVAGCEMAEREDHRLGPESRADLRPEQPPRAPEREVPASLEVSAEEHFLREADREEFHDELRAEMKWI